MPEQEPQSLESSLSQASTLLEAMVSNSTVELDDGDIPQPHLQLGDASASIAVRDPATSRSRVGNSSVPPYPKKKPFQKEVDTLHKLLEEKPDEEEYFGNVIASHLRRCPARLKGQMELELLQVAVKYSGTPE